MVEPQQSLKLERAETFFFTLSSMFLKLYYTADMRILTSTFTRFESLDLYDWGNSFHVIAFCPSVVFSSGLHSSVDTSINIPGPFFLGFLTSGGTHLAHLPNGNPLKEIVSFAN